MFVFQKGHMICFKLALGLFERKREPGLNLLQAKNEIKLHNLHTR